MSLLIAVEVMHSVGANVIYQTNNHRRIEMKVNKNASFRISTTLLVMSLFACGGAPQKPGFNQKEIDKRQKESFRELDRTQTNMHWMQSSISKR